MTHINSFKIISPHRNIDCSGTQIIKNSLHSSPDLLGENYCFPSCIVIIFSFENYVSMCLTFCSKLYKAR